MASFNEFLSSLSADAGKRGKQFEQFVKWFLINDPLWSTQVDIVWLWDEYPQRWGSDCGIDLVFKHKDGQIWAVQAKCYDPKYNITKHDVDKFLSESNRSSIDKRLLIATTDAVGANAKQVCDAQDKEVVRYLLSNFEEADIEYPTSLADLYKAKVKPKPSPKDHQIEAIEAVIKGFTSSDRGQLIMACGTGKTFTTLWIKEALNSESTLILLPSLALLSQTLHEWTLAKNKDFAVLCVCSDVSVGSRGMDEAVNDVNDLAFPVTSEVSEITKFLFQARSKVIFSTYQSSNLIADAQADQKVPVFNLAIADEAHRCAGNTEGNFATILNSQRIRADKRLFTTATPRTYSTALKISAEDRGIEIIGMDNEEVFGRQLYVLNFGDAIRRGLLTDYQVVIVGVDSPMIASYIDNREFVKTESGIENDAETLAAQVALLKAIKDFDLHRVISFHSRINRAEKFAKELPEVARWVDVKYRLSGKLNSDFVSGEMSTFVRRQKLAMLKSSNDSDHALLTNARCLSEGIDVPSLDGIAFIDRRASQVDIIQAVGRAIRLSPKKKAGTIVLPVFIGNGDNPEQTLEEGNFKPIWDVLNALRSHDNVLADELDQMRLSMGKRGSTKVHGGFNKIIINLPVMIDVSFNEAIKTRLVENTTSNWEFWYELMLLFKEQSGHCNPTRGSKFKGYDLWGWANAQRRKLTRNTISQQRKELLLSIGFKSISLDSRWEDKFKRLSHYFEQTGHSNVNSRDSNRELARWVVKQRTNYRAGKLNESQISQLKKLNFDFIRSEFDRKSIEYLSYTNAEKIVREKKINNLLEFQSWARGKSPEYGDFPVNLPRSPQQVYLDNGWTGWPNFLGNANREEANDLQWSEMFDLYVNFVENLGRIPLNERPSELKLANWINTQRVFFKAGNLTEKRIKMLVDVGFSFNPKEDIFNHAYNKLLKFVQREGHARVKQSHKEDEFNLGGWVSRIRGTKLKLPAEKKILFDSLTGWYWGESKNEN